LGVGHYYADDSQLYLSFKPADGTSLAKHNIGKCCDDIRNYLACNMLKLSEDKTEVVVFRTRMS